MQVTNEALTSWLTTRPYQLDLSTADELRLAAYIARSRAEDPDVMPPDEPYEDSLKIAVAACLECGLRSSEEDAGLHAWIDGSLRPLPRYSLRLRLKLALRELRR